MSFREKTAWVTLCALLIVSLMYWLHVPAVFDAQHGHRVVAAMGISLVAYVLIEVVAYVVLYLHNPKDARTDKDERERLIDLKAVRIAYYVFVTGVLGAVFVTVHVVGAGTTILGMAVTVSFVLAQLVKHAARIVYFRRGV